MLPTQNTDADENTTLEIVTSPSFAAIIQVSKHQKPSVEFFGDPGFETSRRVSSRVRSSTQDGTFSYNVAVWKRGYLLDKRGRFERSGSLGLLPIDRQWNTTSGILWSLLGLIRAK